MRVLIAGCGYVGSALGERLASEGHTVFGLRRNPSKLPETITPVEADLMSPGAGAASSALRAALPANLDFVFYTVSPAGSTDEAYRAAYVEGPRNLLDALAAGQDGIRRIIFVSSTGVYAQSGGEWVDEDSPTRPESFSGKRLLEGEQLVLGGTGHSGEPPENSFPGTVLRLAGIYGPGRGRMVERLLEGAGDPEGYTNRIRLEDCAGALRHLMLLEDPEPVYIGSDYDPAERRVVREWLARRVGTNPPEVAGDAAGNRRGTSKRCSNRRLVGSGYVFRYPTFREGFEDLLDR